MTDWLANLGSAGEGMLHWMLWMNVWCAAMVAAAVVADRLLARRVAPTWRMLLYVAVVVRIALPLSLASPIGLANVPSTPVRITLGESGDGGVGAAGAGSMATAGVQRVVTARSAAFTPRSLVVPAYAMGIAALGTAWIVGARRLRRVVRQSVPTLVTGAAIPVPVLRHEATGPVLIGTIRPRLVIPADLEHRAGTSGLVWVLRHEAAHIARRDPIVAALMHAAAIAAWPIAAVWLATARIRALMEEACDERALRGSATAEREEYGRTLIELASLRRVSRFVPSLPFGTGLRSRVRALANTKRWPMSIQCGLVVVMASAIVACAGSRGAEEQQPLNAVQLDNADFGPFKGSLPIRVTILRSWPKHPKLDFALGQYKAGTPQPDWSTHRLLTRAEFAEVLKGATEADAQAVLSRPRLEVIPGMKATVSVGVEVLGDKPTAGFMLDSTVTLVEIPAGSDPRKLYTMDLKFTRHGDDKVASQAEVRGVKVPQDQTVAMLATGLIGGEMLLVCVSPGPDVIATGFGADSAAPLPAIADTRPLIHFIANIHRVDAPKDYGSPKGDGPRKKWSALPGGAEMNMEEFAQYMEELRARPGYSLIAAPSVWVYPDQDATLELTPEADSPEAKQTIHVRGTPEGGAVKTTGGYAREAKGMSTECQWARPRDLKPGGALVWSIHDPELGAWYTVTIQAKVHPAGSIPPQTSTFVAPEER